MEEEEEEEPLPCLAAAARAFVVFTEGLTGYLQELGATAGAGAEEEEEEEEEEGELLGPLLGGAPPKAMCLAVHQPQEAASSPTPRPE